MFQISLIAVVTLIGTRMDLYAVLYSFWLCVLITPRRVLLSKIWGFFTLFILVTIPLQYVLVVGLPPSLCISEFYISFIPDNWKYFKICI
jgi:hypothetical protein